MERVKLRIRIPNISHCAKGSCVELTKTKYCMDCLYARVCEEVSPTTLPSKPKVVHCSPLGSDSGRPRKIY
jgi:hypothetical protein